MSTRLHLAGPDDAPKLLAQIAAFHADHGIDQTDAFRQAALAPLLGGSPHGAAYLIGPRRAPVGYLVISFGYSLEMGGIDGFLDEIYIRPAVRGRGMATEALAALLPSLAEAGVKALHLEVKRDRPEAQGLYKRLRFEPRADYHLMTRRLTQ
ncbi:N-acetyltransferase [Actibacterium sp. 188UL27-1]|uniref:GNAT family N-acetyltransferase n=1 Tax=Actibacterium sp. 188UL27-1 TaxID=2786961 RepID=UPI00195ED1DD|nr:GNAT family N-acetyltransferase [Actibacterium sp. 188UL27-1]MBM7066728.1 GNAT family N-acetyltransferase [Actibacterium sp. 188UL27-1]